MGDEYVATSIYIYAVRLRGSPTQEGCADLRTAETGE